MLRNLAFVVGYAVIQVLSTTASVWAADFGTPEEAKAMLERAVAAVKEDKAKALDMFNNGEGGFKDRDLYVYCANASDGTLTAHPYLKGKQLRDIKGKHGAPLGETRYGECHRGNDKRDQLLVAAPWLRQAARKDLLLHEGRRSDLWCRLLQGINAQLIFVWSADVELRPEAVALAKRLNRASPKTGKRMSLRKIAAALAEAGHLNERGQPFNPKSIVAMVAQKT